MLKKIYALLMTYDVSDEEKRYAEESLLNFDEAMKLVSFASDHLNTIKTPFKDNTPSSMEEIVDSRVILRRFRDKSAQNFNTFKIKAFSCINGMKEFSSDTATQKLMKTFISAIETLEIDVNKFFELFEDLKAKDFQTNVVKFTEDIQSKCDDILDLIDQRIKGHIQTNILAKNWVDGISTELKQDVEKHVPILSKVYEEEKKQFNEIVNK